MILAEAIVISTEAMVIVGGVVAALVSGITYLFFMLTSNRSAELVTQREMFEKRIAAIESDKKSWQEMTLELGINIEKAVNRKRAAEGLAPFEVMKPVVPEHSSPVTLAQQQTADISTMRARLVAATKELGLPPRQIAQSADKEAEVAVDKAASTHELTKLELENSAAADAIQDVVGAIDVARLSADEAATVVGRKEEKPKQGAPVKGNP